MRPSQSGGSRRRDRVRLRLVKPVTSSVPVARWRINGYPVALLLWTPEEWERLQVRPSDAQYHPLGVWCALRNDWELGGS